MGLDPAAEEEEKEQKEEGAKEDGAKEEGAKEEGGDAREKEKKGRDPWDQGG
jgi:hypothetical protein